ncbi:hypothetical protein V5740_04745 [Croceibacterium sp. TMG7-5b_MA50]|uniref:hypothetical protein n=1 Tax=Croceibacterium sp. TMG7-5b_MA50 TaxID=3121290 RepID=UPI0032218F3E
MVRRILLPLAACLIAAVIMPVLFMVAEAAAQRDGIGMDDLEFGVAISAPFALLTALLIVWPTWAWLQRRQAGTPRFALAAIISAIAPMVLLLPVAGELPWKAGLAGLGTMLIWLSSYHAGAGALARHYSIRSYSRG